MLKFGAKVGEKVGKVVAHKLASKATNKFEGVGSPGSNDNTTLLHGKLLINIYSAKGKKEPKPQ